MSIKILFLSLLLVILCGAAFAQTSSFVYQGKLQDSGLAANGTYQFQFKLYDAETGGNQVSLSITDVTAVATNGIFAVNLNFGAGAFNSQEFRFLEIGVRPNGSGQPYTVLNPRQQVTSTPYAIRALSAQNADHAATADDSANLGGIPAAQYVITTDPRMSDERNPLPNSGHYIQNGTSQQTASNFNVSGEGKAFKMTGVLVNATSEFQQGGTRVMQFNNLKSGFVGTFAGPNSTGSDNMFVGYQAGNANLTGSVNAFIGSQTGKSNTTGFNNSFFGAYSGFSNTVGNNNAFFGANSGFINTGSFNSFFGSNSGFSNTSGTDNSFFGNGSGLNHTSGNGNSFFGRDAGKSVTFAANNSFFGTHSGENTTTGGNAYFGAFSGQKNTTGFGNVFVGANAGKENIGGSSNTFVGSNTGQNVGGGGSSNTFVGSNSGQSSGTGNFNTTLGANAEVGLNVTNATAIGANSFATTSNSIQLGTGLTKVFVPGGLSVEGAATFANGIGFSGTITGSNLAIGGMQTAFENSTHKLKFPNGTIEAGVVKASHLSATTGTVVAGQEVEGEWIVWRDLPGIGSSNHLCYYQFANGAKYGLTVCSSSIRYKENVQDFASGLDVVRRLRPVTYDWKRNGKSDLGFIAEEVNKVEPKLSTYNEKGEVEGVKYEQISTVLVNAVKEQQKQIEQQQKEIAALKALVCLQNPTAAVCSAKPVEKIEVKN